MSPWFLQPLQIWSMGEVYKLSHPSCHMLYPNKRNCRWEDLSHRKNLTQRLNWVGYQVVESSRACSKKIPSSSEFYMPEQAIIPGRIPSGRDRSMKAYRGGVVLLPGKLATHYCHTAAIPASAGEAGHLRVQFSPSFQS